MARKRISMNGTISVEEPLHREQVKNDGFVIGDFLRLHEQFMTVKKLEGLAAKALNPVP